MQKVETIMSEYCFSHNSCQKHHQEMFYNCFNVLNRVVKSVSLHYIRFPPCSKHAMSGEPSILPNFVTVLIGIHPNASLEHENRYRETQLWIEDACTYLMKSFLSTRMRMVARNPVKRRTVTHELIIENQCISK